MRNICIFVFLFLITGCTTAPVTAKDNGIEVNPQLCDSKEAFTSIKAGDFLVKLFEPNDATKPDIWQGPLCVVNLEQTIKCGFDLSLIESATLTKHDKAIDVVVFSGSNSRTVQIDLTSCKLSHLDN